jgi:hypothetical protein
MEYLLSYQLGTILGMLKIFSAERMNAYPFSKNINGPGPFTSNILKPAGGKIYTEVEQKFIP